MALQMIYVDDAAPGACGDAGMVYNGTTTITSSKIIAGTSMTMSGTAAITGNVTVNTDKFTVTAASGNTTVGGTLGVTGATACGSTLAVTGASTHNAAMIMSATETAATHGATVVPLTTVYDGYTTDATSAIAATLADGTHGQLKVIKLTLKDTNNMVVTPANLAGGTTLTFDATGEYALLMFVGTAWVVIATNATLA